MLAFTTQDIGSRIFTKYLPSQRMAPTACSPSLPPLMKFCGFYYYSLCSPNRAHFYTYMRMHYCCSSFPNTYLLETEIYSPCPTILLLMFHHHPIMMVKVGSLWILTMLLSIIVLYWVCPWSISIMSSCSLIKFSKSCFSKNLEIHLMGWLVCHLWTRISRWFLFKTNITPFLIKFTANSLEISSLCIPIIF